MSFYTPGKPGCGQSKYSWMLITFEQMERCLNFKKIKWSEFQALSKGSAKIEGSGSSQQKYGSETL